MENELYHYGVLGMGWGVRHDRETTGLDGFRRSVHTESESNGRWRLTDKQKRAIKIEPGRHEIFRIT